jgi:monofunctional biosynthetic peptidoglycan transglycosylase
LKRLLALAAAGVFAFAGYVLIGLPSRGGVRELAAKNPGPTALMRQREREARARKRRALAVQTWVPLSRVSRSLIQAVISSEDQNFFGHGGIDWAAIKESAETNVKRGRAVRGGSTLTQQLAKNLYFGTEKSLTRKLREAIVTHWLEEDLSKVRILTLYLNVIEWGDGIYGCEAAAETWFGRPCADLSVEEAAGLAGMIPNPRRISPKASPQRYERARRRVLWLMAHAGYIEKSVSGLGAAPETVDQQITHMDPYFIYMVSATHRWRRSRRRWVHPGNKRANRGWAGP